MINPDNLSSPLLEVNGIPISLRTWTLLYTPTDRLMQFGLGYLRRWAKPADPRREPYDHARPTSVL